MSRNSFHTSDSPLQAPIFAEFVMGCCASCACADHPYSGPHGAAYLVKITGCDLLSWTVHCACLGGSRFQALLSDAGVCVCCAAAQEKEYGWDVSLFYKVIHI